MATYHTIHEVMTAEIKPNTDANVVRVFVIRHGQTDHNVKKILQGHLDIDINETGFNQAVLVGDYVKHIPFDQFVTSDLKRCVATTNQILKHNNNGDIPLITTSNLRERNMGICEGMYLKDALNEYGENFRNLGENKISLISRIQIEWNKILKNSILNNYTNIGVCTHGGVITGFINHLYDEGYTLGESLDANSLKVPFNTSVSIIDINKETKQGIIQTFGGTNHLGGQFEVKDQLLR